jgi:hypothetical protein
LPPIRQPAASLPLVELGQCRTAPDRGYAKAIYESVGQVPIMVKREIEGPQRLRAVLLSGGSPGRDGRPHRRTSTRL